MISSVYAWFASTKHITDLEAITGSLDSQLHIQYWDVDATGADKWRELPTIGVGGEIQVSLGSLSDMGAVPEGKEVYLKIKASDASGARYIYNIMVADIAIDVYHLNNGNYQKVVGNEFVDTIDYFDESEAQMCFQFNYIVSQNDGLSPNQAFALPLASPERIALVEQSFTGDDFILEEEYLYVMLLLRQAELADIVRRIPVQFLPYVLEFTLKIESETRTADYE